jgi:peptide/nickel transport system substrate-binding protein
MKKGAIWIGLTFLLVGSLFLASCSSSTTANTSTTTTSEITSTTTTTTNTAITSTSTTSAIPVTSSVTTTSTGNWWDSLGTPQYGGTLTIQTAADITQFDPFQGDLNGEIYCAYLDQLTIPNWTIDPSIQNYQLDFFENDQAEGDLAQDWEFTTPGTLVYTLRQGVNWQNIAPSFGRELTAADVVYHFDRMLGIGDGFTTPGTYWAGVASWKSLTSVTATGNLTVTMQWNTPNMEFIYETMEAPDSDQMIEDPDAVAAYGNLNNWHNAIGTGPFILTDFVDNSSATLTKNPNYWGYDERYPQNKLPYINTIVQLIIPNASTAEAALRAGKITAMDSVSQTDAAGIQKTNPSILQIPVPIGNCVTMDPRNDKAPYNNLQVREAMQMAINLPQIAQTYYNGKSESWPQTLTSSFMIGWGLPYSQWPTDLQAQYAYNPTQAKTLLASAGYPNGFNTDIVVNAAADINLVEIVQSYFSAINVNMSITVMQSAAFNAYVLTNHQNDAFAIRQPGANSLGLSFNPLRQLQKFDTGGVSNDAVVNDPTFNAFYPQALAATNTSQVQAIVTAANLYVAQQHFVISLLQPYLYGLCQPWLVGFDDQWGSISGSAGVPLLSFFGARFWINQNLEPGS